MPNYNPNLHIKIILDFLFFLIAGIPSLCLVIVGKPYHRGFFCDDESIKYPDVPNTVPNLALYIGAIFGPVALISAVESWLYLRKRSDHAPVYLKGHRVPPLIWRLYISLGFFLFGAMACQFFTDVAKFTVGRLRPHFLAVCKPNVNCSSISPQKFVIDYECQNTDFYVARETRLSFLSGHASISFYSAIYCTLFLQKRPKVLNFGELTKPCVQIFLVILAWFTALSRVSDYKHHPLDVAAGIFLGSVTAIINAFFVSDLFVPGEPTSKNSLADDDHITQPLRQLP